MPTRAQVARAYEVGATNAQVFDWMDGTLIQEAMPDLSPDQREYIITGLTPEEWDEIFKDQDGWCEF